MEVDFGIHFNLIEHISIQKIQFMWALKKIVLKFLKQTSLFKKTFLFPIDNFRKAEEELLRFPNL